LWTVTVAEEFGVGVGVGVRVGVEVSVGVGLAVGVRPGVVVGVGVSGGGLQPPIETVFRSQSQARTWGAGQPGTGQSVPNSRVTVSPGSTQVLAQRISMEVSRGDS
jgi:hypothetical protein